MMKRLHLLLMLCIVFVNANAQPGKYAGSKKSLIGKTYTDSRRIPGITGWKYLEGSVITSINDPELMTADVFKKGTTYLVIFSIKEDSADTKFTIADVLEIKNVISSRHIRTGTCTDGVNELIDIVALIKKENTEFSKAIKAWRLNRDKRRIEVTSPKLIKCMNEVD